MIKYILSGLFAFFLFLVTVAYFEGMIPFLSSTNDKNHVNEDMMTSPSSAIDKKHVNSEAESQKPPFAKPLTLEEKKTIYLAMMEAEILAIREADRLYNPGTQPNEHLAEVHRLRPINNQKIQAVFKLSNEELDAINTQAMIEEWPMQ